MGTQKASILRKVYPDKDPWSHKGEYGKLLVVAGSRIFTGAPAVIGMAALRSGVDTVFFSGPKRSMEVVANSYPTFITLPLDCGYLNSGYLQDVFDFASDMNVNALAVGPGLWRTDKTRKAVLKLIEGFEIPMVVDADAIRALGDDCGPISGRESIMTPHANEFEELTGVEPPRDLKDRSKIVKEAAKEIGSTIILKGNTDVISDGKKVALNATGNVHMTGGGFGDMLVGVCSALMARRKNKVATFDAACGGAYINGKAGDMAAKEKAEGTTVTDAIEKIPQVIKER